MLNWDLKIWPKRAKNAFFLLMKLQRLMLKNEEKKQKVPDGFVFSSRWFYKTPRVFLKTPRPSPKNTPPFTEKHPTVNFTTPYHHANDTLSWCNTTPVDLLENDLCLIIKHL